MAMNRYGRVYHSDHHYNTLRFPSADARQAFVEKFEKYHASHDHDGEPPRFENTTAAEANKVKVHDADSVTIDGYASYEIHAYHDRNDDRYVHYRPPTTIAPLVIVTENQGEFIDSSTLTRHELSAIFMDMPDEDFQNLLKSVERDGFKDPIIRMIDTQVLDGWHRYRAAKELNLLRKLRFRQWNERDEGDPAAFVMARNIERRHLNPGQRAQIVVSFSQRYGMGRPSAESPSNDELKSREELAKEAGVGTATIDRAVKVEKAGQAEQVISGEKSAGEVLIEQAKTEHTNAWSAVQSAFFDTSLDKHKRFSEFEDTDPGRKLYLFYELTVEAKEMRPNTFSHDFYFEVDGERGRDLTLAEIKAEAEFIQRIAKDIQFYQQGDDCHIGWLEKVLQTESKQAIPGKHQTEKDCLKIELECARGNAENDRRRVWVAFGESDISKSISKEDFALSAAKQHDLYEDSYGSGENYLLAEDYAPIDKLSLKEAQDMRSFFNSVETAIRESADWVLALVETEVVNTTESDVISEARAQVSEILDGLDTPKSTNGVSGENSNYRLEFLSIGLRDADDNPVKPLSFQLIASRQAGEHSLSEVPDALRAELLKLVEKVKS